MNLEVEKGIIKKVKIEGDFFDENDISEIENALINVPHEESRIREVLSQYSIEKYLPEITLDDLLNGMF